jgi:hypothetical protein
MMTIWKATYVEGKALPDSTNIYATHKFSARSFASAVKKATRYWGRAAKLVKVEPLASVRD